ncbi:MAG: prepilin-type N-terminal cleavage/methylation domain-containing protein [Psychromonas sp.]
MNDKQLNFSNKKIQQAGFTLIELMVAMVISLTLIFACTTLYSSLKSSITVAQKLSNAQESLRGAFYLMSRSVRQADDIEVSGASLTVSFATPPTAVEIYGCLGNLVTSGSTDTYYLGTSGLYCDDGHGAAISDQLIALNINELILEESGALGTTATGQGYNGVIVQLQIDEVSAALGTDGLRFNLALRQKVLANLSE